MLKSTGTILAVLLVIAGLPASASVILVDDDFSTDTRGNYTDLGVHFGATRSASDWTVGGGVLNVIGGAQGMLAVEDGGGATLSTPDHFRLSFSFTPTPVTAQDHPGIVFDRTGSTANFLYLRSHDNQAVLATTNSGSISFGPVNTTSGLSASTAYDLIFEIDYVSQIASVQAFGFGGGGLITSSSFTGTDFSNTFGTNSGGAFGLVGFDTENAQIDNLLVEDMDAVASVPTTPTAFILLLGLVPLRHFHKPPSSRQYA